ncbi:RheB small monomeric GTPase [Colletotrichum incanum]|nr:RheB small monomeric GTPase [Colletotrichum incanum]
MATRDGPSVPRKKTTTYGKTSQKRPIHAFLDLSNGSRRATDTTQPAIAPTASADHLYDLYDPPDDEPVHRSISRHDAPLTDATASQPDVSSNPKKRKVSAAPMTKVERARKIDGKPSASAPLARAPSNIRRAKSPFALGTSSSLRATKEEPAARGLGQPKTQRQAEPRPAASRPRVEPEVLRKTETNLQIRRALPQPSHPQPTLVQSKPNTFVTDLSISKPKKLPEPRRVRLIDQLVAQTEVSSESDSDASDDSEVSLAGLGAKTASPSTPARPVDMTPKPSVRPKVLSSTRKLRSTYGQQRTLKADESGGDSLGSQMGFDGSQRDLSPAPTMSKLASFAFEEEDGEEESSSKGGGIIDIHALRQAGANHRFADSMADLLDRVGTPQPPRSPSARSRRNALLELASKLRDKTFVRQFRDQGAKDALFQAIGQEEDLVSGFVLLSVLLVLFASNSVPHLVPQLQSEGIAQLASRLFELDEDIVGIASQRQSNLSRNAQSSLGALKLTIQQLDLWKGSPPAVLSPRTVALKAISVLCKDGDSPATREILAGLTDQLFVFAEKCWEQSRAEGIEGTVGGLALSLLEGYSIAAMESDAGPRWTKLYLPIVADILTAAMARPMQQFGDFESTTLKLALNTTNNNPAAASAFSRGELFRELAEASVVGFELLQQSVRQGAFSKDVYETLMLLLGVMINTTEHCPSTRRSVDAWHERDESPLDKLMEIYLENRESAGTADSVEKTSIAVAHGYLAILLGYLSLGGQVRRRLEEKSHGMGTKYLLDSIQEFMSLHQKLDTDELTTSLQNLVNELRQRHRLSE